MNQRIHTVNMKQERINIRQTERFVTVTVPISEGLIPDIEGFDLKDTHMHLNSIICIFEKSPKP